MDFDDFDFGDFLGIALAVSDEFAEEERERILLEQKAEKEKKENLLEE